MIVNIIKIFCYALIKLCSNKNIKPSSYISSYNFCNCIFIYLLYVVIINYVNLIRLTVFFAYKNQTLYLQMIYLLDSIFHIYLSFLDSIISITSSCFCPLIISFKYNFLSSYWICILHPLILSISAR